MNKRILTLDSNIFIAALKRDEKYSNDCANLLRKAVGSLILVEPSIIYQEVCGVLARKIGIEASRKAEIFLDTILHDDLIINCDKRFCKEAYTLCYEYGIFPIDALYLKTALDFNSILISLDEENFIRKIKIKNPSIKAYHVSEFKINIL
jgi:predicted nucleic acid-binding protein